MCISIGVFKTYIDGFAVPKTVEGDMKEDKYKSQYTEDCVLLDNTLYELGYDVETIESFKKPQDEIFEYFTIKLRKQK